MEPGTVRNKMKFSAATFENLLFEEQPFSPLPVN
jgi:hypothetical protein